MNIWLWLIVLSTIFFTLSLFLWFWKDRSYTSGKTVSSAYDNWTNDQLLERLWGEHVHLGYYRDNSRNIDFRQAKVDFVHHLVRWSGFDSLPRGSRILDVGCGIGGSARILAKVYGFDVLGITISPAQVKRANQLTSRGVKCRFEVMDALDLKLPDSSFDGVWSVEAGPHMPNKQLFADEMLRVLKPDGLLAVADWNRRDPSEKEMSNLESLVMRQLLQQWAHPSFSSIQGFQKNLKTSSFSSSDFEYNDWTTFTIRSWNESIFEGFRRPMAVLNLGFGALIKGVREIPTILLMRWAFGSGLMQFGVFRSKR